MIDLFKHLKVKLYSITKINSSTYKEDKILLTNSFWSLCGSVSSRLIMMLSSIFIARFLGAYTFGQWGVIMSTVTMFTTFLSFGFGVTSMKFISENRKSDPDKASRVFSISILSSIGFGIVLSIVFFTISDFLAIKVLNSQDTALPLKISSFYLLFTSITGVFSGTLMGLDAYKKIAYANLFASILGSPFILFATYHYRLPGTAIAYLFYYFLIGLVYFLVLRRLLREAGLRFTFLKLREEISVLYNFNLPAMISGAIGGPVIWIANTVVARMTNGYTIIGVYNAAKIVQNAIIEIGSQVHNPLITLISNVRSVRSTALSFIIPVSYLIIIVLPLIFFPEILVWMFGKGNYASHDFTIVISLALITGYIVILKQSLGRAIIIHNKVWWGVYENILWSFILLSIIAFMTIRYNIIGFALSFLVAYIVDMLIITPFYILKNLIPRFIFFNIQSIAIWLTIFLSPILLYFDTPLYSRIAVFIVSLLFHYSYLSLLKKSNYRVSE